MTAAWALFALVVAWHQPGAQTPGATRPVLQASDIERMMQEVSNQGRWGRDDQARTVNLITAAKRRQAASLVREGTSVSLSHNPSTEKAVDNPAPLELTMRGVRPGASVVLDEWRVSHHGFTFTHLDALCHRIALVVVLLSAWMSNMVVTAMMLPVVLGILAAQHKDQLRTSPVTTGLLLVVAFSASIGGMITPVGAAPNLITIGLVEAATGTRLSFPMWVAVCFPISLVMAAGLFVVSTWLFPARHMPPPLRVYLSPGPHRLTAGQRNAATAFCVAVVLWVGPGLLAMVAPDVPAVRWLTSRITEPIAALADQGRAGAETQRLTRPGG